MLRILAVTAAFCGCTYAGLRAAGRLRARRDLLGELALAVRTLLAGIRHTGRPVWTLLRCCSGERTGALFARVADAAEAGERVYAAFAAAAEETGILADLTDEDRRFIEEFFAMLGQSDRRSQQESGELALAGIQRNLTEAEAAYAGKGRVYRAMGALTGAGVAILLL